MRQNRLYKCIFLIALLLVQATSQADTGRLYTANEMSSSIVVCVTQDKFGFIWVGTEYGLNRFDGYHFAKYLSSASDSTSIANNEITCFLVDRSGRLFVGCNKGLMEYDYPTDSFRRIHFSPNVTPRVDALTEDEEGNILIGTSGYGVYCLAKNSSRLDHLTSWKRRAQDEFCGRLFVDREQNIWRGNYTSTITRVTTRGKNKASFKDFTSSCGPLISFIDCGKSGFYAVCMYGILRYDYSSGTMSDAGFDLSALGGSVSIRKALADHDGDIYIGTSGKGLMVIRRGTMRLETVANRNGSFDLQTANVNDIYEDKDHNLWASCYKKGLFLTNSGSESFSSWRFSTQNVALGSSVTSIAEAAEGGIWCIVQKSGVYRFDSNGFLVAHPSAPDGASTIYRDHSGQYWLGTENTLYWYDPTSGKSVAKAHFDGWGLNCMTDDGKGTLYICNYSKGLSIFNTLTGELRSLSMYDKNNKHGTLNNDWIKALFIDSRGLLWIGCADGLSCMNPQTLDFRVMGWESQLDGLQCLAFNETPDGKVLIGTSAGLYIYDRARKSMNRFPESDRLAGNSIHSVVLDDSGDVWMSTANGIWQWDKTRRKFIAHLNGNGLSTREYVLGAMLKHSDGRIAFGINDGVTVFLPKQVKTNHGEHGTVHLTSFIMAGKSIDCTRDRFLVPYNNNSFSMGFSLLNFRNADNITFAYRINGKEPWTPLPEGTNTLVFTNLEPGKYVIDVRAELGGEVISDVESFRVRVKNPWYSSPWAYLCYALLAIAAVAGAFIFYDRRRKAELEEAKMRFLIDATHDIRSPLTLIMNPLSKLRKQLEGNETCRTYIDTIDHNAQRLLMLVNQILDERKLDRNQMHLHCRETDLVQFVNRVSSLYSLNAKQHDISLRFHSSEKKISAWIDRMGFEKVIANLLSNAFKFTPDGGEVDISLERSGEKIMMTVTDSGTGFENENTERLFDRFYQGASARKTGKQGTGIGLNLCRALVTMHGGTITAANRDDGIRGARMTVTIPSGNAHLKPEEIETEEETTEKVTQNVQRNSKNYRILLVDDDMEIMQYIKDELSKWYRFDFTNNGKEALKALLSQHYDLVISDVVMPEMDGIALLKQIKGNTLLNDTPVILLTSRAEAEERMEGFKRGADAYMAKPFNIEELHVMIENLVSGVRRLKGKFSGAQKQQDKVENVEVRGNNDVLMQRVMKVINENLADPDFNVERLTTEVGISRAQLHRKMKEITGISTAEFIRNIRLEQAARLLKEGKVNVTQVTYAVGFNNQTHFSSLFRRHFGMSPSEYAATEDAPSE